MNVMALDLELNQPSKTIIQVGISVGNVETGDIKEKKGWIIYTDEDIDPFITKLTTITTPMVRAGVTIDEAYKEMVELYDKYNCDCTLVTWGGGDTEELKEALYKFFNDMNVTAPGWKFGRRWMDTKTLFLAFDIASRFKKGRGGLSKSMTRVGLNFQGTKHWAPDDAFNTLRLFIFLLKRLPKDVIIK